MIVYIRGGSAGEMFTAKCKECDESMNWNKLVVEMTDYKKEVAKRCIPCHEDKYGKLRSSV